MTDSVWYSDSPQLAAICEFLLELVVVEFIEALFCSDFLETFRRDEGGSATNSINMCILNWSNTSLEAYTAA